MSLFSPLTLRGVTLPHRIAISPMCQYSAGNDGIATDWHLAHLGARAIGRAALVMVEATAVLPEGRISPADLGLWDDAQIEPLARIAAFLRSQGTVPAIQLAHAGRKASTSLPWEGRGSLREAEGRWTTVAPSPVSFGEGYDAPEPLDRAGIERVLTAFGRAAQRAKDAGFEVVELHAAHGYLLHEFLSPLSNRRTDAYGGAFGGRVRIVLEAVDALRAAWPDDKPVFVRVSATDWVKGGWDIDETVELARLLRARGVDLVDTSSGGLSPAQRIVEGPGYQVPFAERIRREAGIATGAVGLITTGRQAADVVRFGQADVVFVGRESLRRPHFPLEAAAELGETLPWPRQYARAQPRADEGR